MNDQHQEVSDFVSLRKNLRNKTAILSLFISLFSFLPLLLTHTQLYTILPTVLFPILSLVAVVIFVVFAKDKLTNVFTFATIILLLSVIFPLIHFGFYKLNKSNYKFDTEFLLSKTNSLADDTSGHISIKHLEILASHKDSILDLSFDKINTDNIYFMGIYILRVEQVNTPESVNKIISLYSKDGLKIGNLYFNEKSIRTSVQAEKNFLLDIKDRIKNPQNNVFLNDFWIESITAFSFGHISPSSNITILTRGIQLMVVFVFFAMFTNTLRAMGKFVMETKR